jgi:CRISPR-associated endonuclease/helicase Cas3
LLDRSVDVAERATRQSRLRAVVRLHNVFPGRSELRELPAAELRPLLRTMLETEIADGDERRRVLAVLLKSRFERHYYSMADDENPERKRNELIVFKTLIEPPNPLELPTPDEDDGEDDLSEGNAFIPLAAHTQHVVDRLTAALGKLHLKHLEPTVVASAPHHDIGKADVRFQAVLAGVTPYEAMMLPHLLGKGDGVRRTRAEQNAIFERAMFPRGFRHEMLSIELIEHLQFETGLPHRDLFLHLIAAHHGYARPFAPVCLDEAADDELRSVSVNGNDIPGGARKTWTPSHRLDSGVAERFWKLTREHGWWGLAWLESILRLADQQASAVEQERSSQKGGSR